eukprot:scaffold8471_cov184-Amphora_coffeaeformis.AAC.4
MLLPVAWCYWCWVEPQICRSKVKSPKAPEDDEESLDSDRSVKDEKVSPPNGAASKTPYQLSQ